MKVITLWWVFLAVACGAVCCALPLFCEWVYLVAGPEWLRRSSGGGLIYTVVFAWLLFAVGGVACVGRAIDWD